MLDATKFQLIRKDGVLQLALIEEPRIVIFADFLSGIARNRRATSGKKNLLYRAVGFNKMPLRVLDATAGLGTDAVQLAMWGAEVSACERSQVLHELCVDALQRACAEVAFAKTLQGRLKIFHTDARAYMRALTLEQCPEVVYLDPMYPESKRTALPNKIMQVQRALLSDTPDDSFELWQDAMKCARRRVVVKRPLWAKPLSENVSAVFKGKTMRFDMYLVNGAANKL